MEIAKEVGTGRNDKTGQGKGTTWGGEPLRATKEGVGTNSKGYGKQEVQACPSYRE